MDFESKGSLDIKIARSEKGVYFVALETCWIQDKCLHRVCILNESHGQTEWILKHDKDRKSVV